MLSDSEIIIRLMVSLVLALILWIEREYKQQPAWIRTHILICVWSCLLMILSIIVPEIYHSTNKDPARIAAQVVSGIGFLWAGAIMRNGLTTKGLTTAANIWVTAAIGLAVGAGLYISAIVTTGIILVTLIVVTKIKPLIFSQNSYCAIDMSFPIKWGEIKDYSKILKKLSLEIISENIKETSKIYQLHYIVRIPRTKNMYSLKEEIQNIIPCETLHLSENIKTV